MWYFSDIGTSISVLHINSLYALFFFFVSLCGAPAPRLLLLFISMSRWGRNRQRQVISDGLMVMTVVSQAEWMGLIERRV